MSLLFSLILLLQGPAAAPPVVTVSPAAELVVPVQGSADATLSVTINEGFHIQANPASERYLVPARLELREDPRVRLGKPIYPPGRQHRLRGADTDLSTYEGRFSIHVSVEASGQEETSLVVEGRLHYQACNDRVCLRPASVPVRIPLRIRAQASESGRR